MYPRINALDGLMMIPKRIRLFCICGLVTSLWACTVDNADYDPLAGSVLRQDGAAVEQADGAPPQADRQPVRPKQQQPAPAPSCKPGAFIRCLTPTQMLRCAANGKDHTGESCPHGCNGQTKKCNQCNPNQTPYCKDGALIICSSQGESSSETCKYGCQQGSCLGCAQVTFFRDADGDGYGDPAKTKVACQKPVGYSTDNTDCDDTIGEVMPGQILYFKEPIASVKSASAKGGTQSFDYNCDSIQEQQHPKATSGSCTRKGQGCQGSGWVLLVPPCGGGGLFIECKPAGPKPKDGCKEVVITGTQFCR